MEMREYLNLCTQQLRCKAMRPVVEKELCAHIEDQAQAYMEEGMERRKAQEQAVRQMGDPVETGMALDRIHRPKMDWKMTLTVLVLALIGVVIQVLLGNMTGDFGLSRRFFVTTALGIALMFGVCFLDYTVIGKYPRLCWLGGIAALAAVIRLTGRINGSRRIEWLIMLLVPLYAGIVFCYRQQRGIGILKALIWLAPAIFLVMTGGCSLLGKMWICGCFVMLGYAVAAGWYHVRRWIGALILALPAVGGLGVGIGSISGAGFLTERFLGFLNPEKSPSGAGYMYLRIREAVETLQFFGKSNMADMSDDLFNGENYVFLTVSRNFGWAAGMIILALLLTLVILAVCRIGKQVNRLGAVVCAGCVYVLLLPVILHPLMNLGLFFQISCALPFFSMNGKQNVSLYLLMGILLSVFRGVNIRPEPQQRSLRQKGSIRQVGADGGCNINS